MFHHAQSLFYFILFTFLFFSEFSYRVQTSEGPIWGRRFFDIPCRDSHLAWA